MLNKEKTQFKFLVLVQIIMKKRDIAVLGLAMGKKAQFFPGVGLDNPGVPF